ncbi:hypothetical protein [Porphyromonas gingivicanis]|uniref:hypothetical protein n=1 Tax=Porphyromonas gingivicanis TaxID=266762 RepID=UPI0004713AAB|nr:hypothetical protein [Porphyromonas gingivicanis]
MKKHTLETFSVKGHQNNKALKLKLKVDNNTERYCTKVSPCLPYFSLSLPKGEKGKSYVNTNNPLNKDGQKE